MAKASGVSISRFTQMRDIPIGLFAFNVQVSIRQLMRMESAPGLWNLMTVAFVWQAIPMTTKETVKHLHHRNLFRSHQIWGAIVLANSEYHNVRPAALQSMSTT